MKIFRGLILGENLGRLEVLRVVNTFEHGVTDNIVFWRRAIAKQTV